MKPNKEQLTNLFKNGNHACLLPWIHFHAWPDSRVMPCCVASSDLPVSKLDPDKTILEVMNSERFKEIRKAMLNDEAVPECTRCYDLEAHGITTMRKSHNERRGEANIEYIIANTEEDGTLTEFEMKYMDIRFSNLCNMKCRSCGPSCSSLWAQEYVAENGKDKWDLYYPGLKPVMSNNENNSLIPKLKPYLDQVEEVYFAGGEIIIQPEHYECLDHWLETGLNETIELNYTTNFSTLRGYKSKNLLEYWSKFKNIQVWGSLDAHGPLAECIRKGTDWDKIEKNIRDLREKLPHVRFQITPTISIWNIFTFPEFYEYMVENNLISTEISPRLNIATFPWYANIAVLPQFTKLQLIEKYKRLNNKYGHYNIDFYNSIKSIINALTTGNENKEGILKFKQFNDDLDAIRKEKFEDLVPQIKEAYLWAES